MIIRSVVALLFFVSLNVFAKDFKGIPVNFICTYEKPIKVGEKYEPRFFISKHFSVLVKDNDALKFFHYGYMVGFKSEEGISLLKKITTAFVDHVLYESYPNQDNYFVNIDEISPKCSFSLSDDPKKEKLNKKVLRDKYIKFEGKHLVKRTYTSYPDCTKPVDIRGGIYWAGEDVRFNCNDAVFSSK